MQFHAGWNHIVGPDAGSETDPLERIALLELRLKAGRAAPPQIKRHARA